MKHVVLLLLLMIALCPAEVRTWTDARGNQTNATLQGFDGGEVLLLTAAGKRLRVPIANFSADDQAYVVLNIASVIDSSPSSPVAGGPSSTPKAPPMRGLAKRTWPVTLAAPDGLTNADYVEAASKAGHHLYRSRRFEYVLHAQDELSSPVMKEVARVFEGTYELLSQSPFGVQAQPVDGYFRAHLYQTMEMYRGAGGPPGSGGMYKRDEKLFHVPIESLGLKAGRGGYVRDENYELKTLVHEITHMMMHDILPLLPKWFIEGSAEYVECIPFKAGAFRPVDLLGSVQRYNADRLGGRVIGGPPLDSFSRIMMPPWVMPKNDSPNLVMPVRVEMPVPQVAFYHSSLLLIYYFMHLDGDGKGTRLLKFLDAVRAEQVRHATYMRQFESYEAEMAEFMKKPGVTRLAGDRIQYPNYLKPPESPPPPHEDYLNDRIGYIHMGILLDGRTESQLGKEAVDALSKVRITASP